METRLYIVRGPSGSGKTTFAKKLGIKHRYEADQYFMQDGEYKWNPHKLKEARERCFEKVKAALLAEECVVVSNTFVRRWEMEKYLQLAKELGIGVTVYRCTGKFKNVHNVPENKVEEMHSRMENYAGEVYVHHD